MDVSIKEQLLCALYSVILGIFLGNIYNIFKTVRCLIFGQTSEKLENKLKSIRFPLIKEIRLKKKGLKSKTAQTIFLFFWDILYFIFITPFVLVFIFATSYGIPRWYIFLGAFLGFLIYHLTVGVLFKRIFEVVIFVLIIIKEYVKLPFKWLYMLIMNKIKYILNKMKEKRALKRKNKPKNDKNKRKTLLCIGKITE